MCRRLIMIMAIFHGVEILPYSLTAMDYDGLSGTPDDASTAHKSQPRYLIIASGRHVMPSAYQIVPIIP